jgi:selT/selW/selH-like putative selenoprotein
LNKEGFDAETISGETGQFDVRADGRLVFSKEDAGRFPEDGEVRAALKA